VRKSPPGIFPQLVLRCREYPKNKEWMVWLLQDFGEWDRCLMYGSMLPTVAEALAEKINAEVRLIKSDYSNTPAQMKAWKAKNLPKPGAY
jgi:hypothetical protein